MNSSPPHISYSDLTSIIQHTGLQLLGVLPVQDANRALRENRARLEMWQEAGYAGEMGYMLRDTGLFTEIDGFLPGTQTVLSLAVNYATGAPPELPQGFGRIARYAWGRDYHRVLKK